jgi:hypothetical protein
MRLGRTSLATLALASAAAAQPAAASPNQPLRVTSSRTRKTNLGGGAVQVTFIKRVTNTGSVTISGLILHVPAAANAGVGGATSGQLACGIGTVDTPASYVASQSSPLRTVNGEYCTVVGGLRPGATATVSMCIDTGAGQPTSTAAALARGAKVNVASGAYPDQGPPGLSTC